MNNELRHLVKPYYAYFEFYSSVSGSLQTFEYFARNLDQVSYISNVEAVFCKKSRD